MNCKNCNIALLWLAGGLLAVSLLFPNGFSGLSLPDSATPAVDPVVKVTDPTIVKLLAEAKPEDLARINGVYSALSFVLKRDNGKRITTTEQWEELAANTLQLAIEHPGTYSGLDEAIEAVFLRTVGTDDVLPGNPETLAKLIEASDIVANSAAR